MDKALQKELAIKCLEKLDIYKPYINKFKSAGMPCFYENYAGFWADQEPELWNKIKEFESERESLVYAVTHERSNIGETWSLLYVPKDTESVDELLDRINPQEFYAFAYVWNITFPDCSEAGDIVVRSAYGGLKRIG